MEYLGKRSVASFLGRTLSVIWWMGIVMIGLFLIFSTLMIVFGPPKGVHFDLGAGNNQLKFSNGANFPQPPHFTLDADIVQVEFADAVIKQPQQLVMVFLSFGAVMIGLGMAIIYQLRKIFATLAAGNPFVLENAKRMRKISFLIFSGVIVELIAGSVIGRMIMKNVVVKGVLFNIKADLNIGGIFTGLVILILAEIFRQGALLKEEQELTI